MAVNRKGERRGGRQAGVPNKFTSAVRTAFEQCFRDLQTSLPKRGEKNYRLLAWAKENPADFYKLIARMVPQEISGPGGGAIPLGVSGSVTLYMPDNGRVNGAVTQQYAAPKQTLKLKRRPNA